MVKTHEDQIKMNLEYLIQDSKKQIINDLFIKYVAKIVADKNILNKKFECDRLTHKNYRHDFAGICAYIHEVSFAMSSDDYVIRFSYCNNNDFTNSICEYSKEKSIFINNRCVYHDAESGGEYFEQTDDEEKMIIDVNVCTEDVLDVLKIFFDNVLLIF